MCGKAIETWLPVLKFESLWSVRTKMIKTFDDDLFSDDDIIIVNGDSNYVTFLVMKWELV